VSSLETVSKDCRVSPVRSSTRDGVGPSLLEHYVDRVHVKMSSYCQLRSKICTQLQTALSSFWLLEKTHTPTSASLEVNVVV